MSELIVQMEMPKNCIDCCVRLKCDLYMNELMKPSKQRNFKAIKPLASNGCLIRGVLPEQHGRLIDEAVFCENVAKYSHQSTKTIGKALEATPTIIDMTLIDTERSETNGNAD